MFNDQFLLFWIQKQDALMIWVMQIMSGTPPDTNINALVNIIILPSENILLRNMILTTRHQLSISLKF